jgi:uncharacterized repeat protein (TIGR01451 family)
MGVTTHLRRAMLLIAAVSLAACSGDVSAPSDSAPSFNSTPTPGVGVAKRGPAGTTATFQISATGGNLPLGTTVTVNACDEGQICEVALVWVPTSNDVVNVTVTEIAASPGVAFGEIQASRTMDGVFTGFSVYAPDAPTITFAMNGTADALVRFKNVGVPNPALRVVKSAASGTVQVGSPMSFSISVFSDGPGTATGVTLTDPLPGGAGISWSTSTAGCTISGTAPTQTLNCTFGDLAAGASRTVNVTSGTSASQSVCGAYPNTATVNATNHASVQASATINLAGCAPAGEGCTPGFWKQEQHFDYWTGYKPKGAHASIYNTVFGVTLFAPNATLLQVLNMGGAPLERFGRHSVAALLNAASSGVNYGMTAAQVISAVREAAATGDFGVMDRLSDRLEDLNERDCRLPQR